MAKKKKFSGKKVLSSGLGALISSQFNIEDNSADSGDEVDSLMGSMGPKGATKSKLLSEILESSCSVIDSNLDQRSSSLVRAQDRALLVAGIQNRQLYKPPVEGSSDCHLCKSSSSCNSENLSARVSWAEEIESELSSSRSKPISNHVLLVSNTKNDGALNLNTRNNVDDSSLFLNEDNKVSLDENLDPPLEISKNPTKSWSSLFSDNRRPGKVMVLNYLPSDTNDSVIFNEEEWNDGASMWSSSIIGQVLGLNVSFKAMQSYVLKVWSHVPKICLLRAGLFLFKFNDKEAMNEVLCNGPWFFGSRPMLLKPWTIDMETNKSDECLYPLWIQLPALRLNLWNSKSLSKIASIIGKLITTDMLTANKQRLSYARVLVKVKMPSHLPDHITIQGPNGKSYNQKVLYEFKPRWCDICKFLGHDTNLCKKKKNIQKWVPKVKPVFDGFNPAAPTLVVNQEAIKVNNKGKSVAHEVMQASNLQSPVHVVHVSGNRPVHNERSRLHINIGKSIEGNDKGKFVTQEFMQIDKNCQAPAHEIHDFGDTPEMLHFQGNSSINETQYANTPRLNICSEPAHLVNILVEATEARSVHVVHRQYTESGSPNENITWIPCFRRKLPSLSNSL